MGRDGERSQSGSKGRALSPDDSWQQLKELVDQALDLPEAERSAFLDEACGDDENLRRKAGSFLEAPVLGTPGKPLDPEQHIGPYRIEKKLGAGGMGEVYQAYDTRLERSVAIKFIRLETLEDANAKERFRREAQAAAGLNHPTVVQIYDLLPWQGRECIVMELVEGQPLTALLRDGPLDLEQALDLAGQIAEGLAAAHAEGIVHRDLKASNVVVTPTGRAKILDFGLAKQLAHSQTPLSISGAIYGTVESMSPEQANGEDVDHRSDLFSFGVLLYRMVTAVSPFRGETMGETLGNVYHTRQPAARQLNPRVPESLSALIDRLLKKDPRLRFQTAVEVVRQLERLDLTQHDDDSAEEALTHSGGSTEQHPRPPAEPSAHPPDEAPETHGNDHLSSPERSLEDPLPVQPGRWKRYVVRGVLAIALAYLGILLTSFYYLGNYFGEDRYHQTLATVERMRWLPQPDWVEAHVDLYAARAHFKLGEFRQAHDLAAAAVAKGMDYTVAQALHVQGAALQGLGEHKQARKVLRQSKLAYEARDDQEGVADVLNTLYYSLIVQGELEGAISLFEELLEIYRNIDGDKRKEEAAVLTALGDLLAQQDRMQEAESRLTESLDIFLELDNRDGIAAAKLNLGTLNHRMGYLDEAEELYLEARDRYNELKDLADVAICDTNLGEISYHRGDLPIALESFKEALKGHFKSGDQSLEAYTKFLRGKVFTAQGALEAARRDFEWVLEKQEDLGELDFAAETMIELAKLALSEGNFNDAVTQATSAEQFLRQQIAKRTLAQTVLIHARLGQGNLAEALKYEDDVQKYAREGQTLEIKLAAQIAVGRLRAAKGDPALDVLETAALEASKYGFEEYEHEARLASREIDRSQRQLDTLIGEAGALGFQRIVQRAQALRD